MTNQQSAVLIALAKNHIPRTPDAIAAETGYPKPSIRRTVGQLREAGYTILSPNDNPHLPGEYTYVANPSL